MEINELKQAWQTLDQRLERQHRLDLLLFAEARLVRAKSRLRPLFWGHLLQMLFGVTMILLGVSVWRANLDVPELLLCGVVMHVYGIVLIVCAGVVLGKIASIDQAAPVLDIQKRLGRLRNFYIGSNTAIGVAWWLIWIPFVAALLYWLAGVNVIRSQPLLTAWAVGISVLGLVATLLAWRWASNPQRPRLARFIEDHMIGSSLRKARADIDEIERFERE